jgi:hypothetical protein
LKACYRPALFAWACCLAGAAALVSCTADSSTISGTVTPPASGAGVTVVLTGPEHAITTTDATGAYRFAGLVRGHYTLTPTASGTTFSPHARPVALQSRGVTGVDFSASSSVVFFDDFAGTALAPAWTIIERHGEYAQHETECNRAQQVGVADGLLSIATAALPTACGDFNIDGTPRHTPSLWPYSSGDLQWKSLRFTYGTVTVRARFPARGAGLWPAIWLLGSNCQNTNVLTADVGYDSCPPLESSAYAEVDMVECDLNNWCQLALANLANTGSGGGRFPTCGFAVDTDFHLFTLTWTANAVALSLDGRPTGCTYTSPAWTIPSTPMFLIAQIQTGGEGGKPDDALLPARLQIDFIKVTQP